LFAIYSFYLNKTQIKTEIFSCSPITKRVAQDSDTFAKFFGYDTAFEQNTDELSMKLFLNGKHTVSIVEGCSSVSIIILFLSFIIAFSGSFRDTLFFGIGGSVFIYITNLARIVMLTVLYQEYPQHGYFLHELFFPAVIYGMVFLLWVIWVKYFSHYNKLKTDE
jgi:exosortase family protein XrtF